MTKFKSFRQEFINGVRYSLWRGITFWTYVLFDIFALYGATQGFDYAKTKLYNFPFWLFLIAIPLNIFRENVERKTKIKIKNKEK